MQKFKKLLLVLMFLAFSGACFLAPPVQAQAPAQAQHFTGKITRVVEEQTFSGDSGDTFYAQELEISIPQLDQTIQSSVGSEYQPLTEAQRLKPGTKVVLSQQYLPDGSEIWVVTDVYRLPVLLYLAGGFLVLVVLVSKGRGLAATGGMVISGAILFGFIIPQIVAGQNPLVISLVGAIGIALATVYLSHGWHIKSHVSAVALIGTLLAVTLLSEVSVQVAQLVGLGSEEAAFLMAGEASNINLQGLLLGGIILGALGVLDDVIVSQVSVVQQLLLANKKFELEELYQRALEVGKDHVASLVNTLVLAYAGANLPLFLLFYLNRTVPYWVTINDQLIAEEIVRTLVGSIGLILAVPLTSLIAAFVFKKYGVPESALDHHHH